MKKVSKRILSSFIALIMVITILPAGFLNASAAIVVIKPGDIIKFGSYPQTRVTNPAMIDALNASSLSADNTVTYNYERYKRVYFMQYTPYYPTLAPIESNTSQDDNGYLTQVAYWFRYDPIEWRVLSNTNGELFVVSDKILDTRAYKSANVTATWEISTIRGWLNDNFYGSAFSSAERSKIVMSDLYNPDNGEHGTEGGNDTRDKVFLLSNQEAITEAYGFDPSNSSASILRRAVGTDYSKSQGLAVVASGDFTGSTWWMRSPGQAKTYAGYVQWNGVINGDGIRVDYSCIGIRPALRIFTATTGVTLSDTAVSLTVGNATQLTATVTPADASNKTVIWGTTDTGVATVAWGKVTAKAPGKATITVTTQNGGFTAVCNIKVIPPAPAGLTAKAASYNSVKLSWSAVSGVTGYLVYRYNAGTDSYQQLAKTTSTGYTNTPLTAGKTYKYKVKAYKTVSGADYISDFTTVASAAPVPAAPGSFTVAKASSTSIKISWGAAAGASGYQVFRASSSTGPFSPVKTTTSKSFTDTGLTKNKTYSYKVRAYKTVNGEKIYGKFTAVKSAKPY